MSGPTSGTAPRSSYVLPLRWERDAGRLDELTRYLLWLRDYCEVIVVDGSPQPAFDRHAAAWAGVVHCRPDPDLRYLNGKVNGVLTGLRRASAGLIVLADDDVRYNFAALHAVVAALRSADLVVPQNVFAVWPWHARWDTARSLLNRSYGRDYPGTLGLRRSSVELSDGYDGDVLFENLELIRTVTALGGRVHNAPDLYVARLPPSTDGFWAQRVRQAYDSLAQPARLLAELSLLPALGVLSRRHPLLGPMAAALGATAVAEIGRRRAGGDTVYPRTAALWMPAWLVERGICSWVAIWQRIAHGGVRYAGHRIRVAAHSTSQISRAVRAVGRPGHETGPGHDGHRRTA